MPHNRLGRTLVTLFVAVLMAALPAALVGPSDPGDDGWTRLLADHAVVVANEQCEVDPDTGETTNCSDNVGTPITDPGPCIAKWACRWVAIFIPFPGLVWACEWVPCP